VIPGVRRFQEWRVPPALFREPLFRRAVLAAAVVAAVFLALYLARYLGLIAPELWALLQPALTEGALNTFQFSLTVIPIGVFLGFLLGWARVSGLPVFAWPAGVYIDLIRGIPALILVLFAFFAGPLVFGGRQTFVSGVLFALVALAIHTSAYQAEIFRAGFQSVPRGQVEAAQAIGLSSWAAMRHVVLPQTFRVALPALGNEFATVIKDTSLLAAIGAAELVYWGRNSAQFGLFNYGIIEWVIIIWLVIALLYFVITYVLTQIIAAIEHAYRVPGLGTVAY